MDVIGTVAEFVTSVIPSEKEYEPVKIVVQFIIYVLILGVIAFAKPIAIRITWIRRKIEPGDTYAGKYVQIIGEEENRRYSIIEIFFDPKSKRYLLKGNQYDSEGSRAIDFTSQNVAFREGPINYMEFVWFAEIISDKSRFDGYTMMQIDDKTQPDMFEGRGFFVTFHHDPLRFNLRFFRITEERLKKLNEVDNEEKLTIPITEHDRHNFVVKLHSILAVHPSLQPTEESGKALL